MNELTKELDTAEVATGQTEREVSPVGLKKGEKQIFQINDEIDFI